MSEACGWEKRDLKCMLLGDFNTTVIVVDFVVVVVVA